MQNNIIYLIHAKQYYLPDSPNLTDFNQILDVTERKISVFIACRTFNWIALWRHLCFSKIQLAFAFTNEKVPEIQNHNFLELCFKTLSLQY